MAMFECPICYENYNPDRRAEHAVTLACGHTFCRDCLTSLPSKLCPNDRSPIVGDIERLPPNYSIHEAITANQPAADPFGVAGAASLLLPEEDLVIGEVLGRGSTSVVHRGTLKGNQVAVKVMQLESGDAAAPGVVALKREMSVMLHSAACYHLCRYLGVVKTGWKFCIVMQLYTQNLKTFISTQPGGKLSFSAAMPLAMAVARGLRELHSRHIIACNLMPANILLTDTEHAVIADFGISRVVSSTVGCVRPTNAPTVDNYMAPEQMSGKGAAGDGVSCKADIWAFACTFIHMLTGKPPLHASSSMQLMQKVLTDRTPHLIPDGLPPAMAALLHRCMSYDSSARPTSKELVGALRDVLIQQQDRASALEAQVEAVKLSTSEALHEADLAASRKTAAAEIDAALARTQAQGAHAELELERRASSALILQIEAMQVSNSSALLEGERLARNQTAEAQQAASTARRQASAMQAQLAQATEATSDLQTQVAALQVSSDAAMQAGTREAQSQAAAAQLQILSMQEELVRLNESLRLACQAREVPPSAAEEPSGIHAWSERIVVHVPHTTTTLTDLLRSVNSATLPTVYDLGGQHLQSTGSQSLFIDASYVTLRNGTIHQGPCTSEEGASLSVRGSNVVLDDIMIIGGHVGLSVRPGAEVTMRNCVVLDAHTGVWVGGVDVAFFSRWQEPTRESNLLAMNLTIMGCDQGPSLSIGAGGAAVLTDCSFSGGGGHGMHIWGGASTRLTANGCVASGHRGTGLVVQTGASAELIGCSLMENKEGSMVVKGAGSKVLVRGCTFGEEPLLCEGGEMNLGFRV